MGADPLAALDKGLGGRVQDLALYIEEQRRLVTMETPEWRLIAMEEECRVLCASSS